MSYYLTHLTNAWQVDQAILNEDERLVVIRFGHDWDAECMKMDQILYSIAEKVRRYSVIYVVDVSETPDFNEMYELYDPCTVMIFFRNKHMLIDLGTGNNNKINWALQDKQEMLDILEVVYKGAHKAISGIPPVMPLNLSVLKSKDPDGRIAEDILKGHQVRPKDYESVVKQSARVLGTQEADQGYTMYWGVKRKSDEERKLEVKQIEERRLHKKAEFDAKVAKTRSRQQTEEDKTAKRRLKRQKRKNK